MKDKNLIPSEIKSIDPAKVTELDVRPILKSGGEPFNVIMSAVGKTSPDGALKLRATFKPTPLFHALGSRGWQNWIEKGEGDDWIVWFYREQKDHPELQTRLKVEGNLWRLDVRRLSPPDPMELTLTVLEKLPRGATLIQINERIPQFLLPILEERGFRFVIEEGKGPDVHVEIMRAP